MTTVHNELVDAALAFANTLRAISGKPPADRLEVGVPLDCIGCPIARTAGAAHLSKAGNACGGWHVGPVAALLGRDGRTKNEVNVPPMASVFMAAFDAGEYPELVAPDVEALMSEPPSPVSS